MENLEKSKEMMLWSRGAVVVGRAVEEVDVKFRVSAIAAERDTR